MARWVETASGELKRAPAPATRKTSREMPLVTDAADERLLARYDGAERDAGRALKAQAVAGRVAERLFRKADAAVERRADEVVAADAEQDARRQARRDERARARMQAKQARALKNAAL